MKIAKVEAIALSVELERDDYRVLEGSHSSAATLLVVVTTDDGIVGFGESLARLSPKAHSTLLNDVLAQVYVGSDPFEADRLLADAFRRMSGKRAGVVVEAIAAIDIALWDIMGKAVGQPIHRLLAGVGRDRLLPYASCTPKPNEKSSIAQLEQALQSGYRMLKIVFDGLDPSQAVAWAKQARAAVGDDIHLCADANSRYSLHDAIEIARGLRDLDFYWFEEPISPEDVDGYKRLRDAVPLRLAAGQSEYTALGARELISSRAIGLIQPDAVRSGGISETRRIVTLAQVYGVMYAPHVGHGGAISAAANIQLSAAMPNFLRFECMFSRTPLRTHLTSNAGIGEVNLQDGMVHVPAGPGLGVEVDFDFVERYRIN